jgi:hypothetical protein
MLRFWMILNGSEEHADATRALIKRSREDGFFTSWVSSFQNVIGADKSSVTCLWKSVAGLAVNVAAAMAASQYTRFLSSRAINGSCLQSSAMVTRHALPLLRLLLKRPCPKREGNATDQLTRSVTHASRSASYAHTWSVQTPTAVKWRRQQAGRKRARVLEMLLLLCDSHTSTQCWSGEGGPTVQQGDTCRTHEQVSVREWSRRRTYHRGNSSPL